MREIKVTILEDVKDGKGYTVNIYEMEQEVQDDIGDILTKIGDALTYNSVDDFDEGKETDE